MFNTVILDVAIGMIFLFLLLSLISSAMNEVIELWLKKRASDLEHGLRELLDPGKGPGASQLVQRLYNHPLINGLFEGQYEGSGITNISRYFKGTALPSYIPARNFALALMDLVLPGQAAAATGGQSGTAGATAPPPSGPSTVTVNVQPPTAAATVPLPAPAGAAMVPVAAPPPTPLASLRSQITTIGNQQVEQALVSLIDAAGNDVTRARENIENWFNSSMDRVSGWYKRRSQIFILSIGLVIAALTNADAMIVAKQLASDRALRESIVAEAEDWSMRNASPTPTPSPTTSPATGSTGTTTSTTSATPVPTPTPTACVEKKTECEKKADSDQCKTKTRECNSELTKIAEEEKCWKAVCTSQPGSPECNLKKSRCQLESLGLAIGWNTPTDPKRWWPGWTWAGDNGGWWDQIKWHYVGWLLTALAISLGAPFWFDLLNKFIVVRSTVKPREKSPEEKPK